MASVEQFREYAAVMKKKAEVVAPFFRTRYVAGGTALGVATGVIVGDPAVGGYSMYLGALVEGGKLLVKGGKLTIRGGKRLYRKIYSNEVANQN